MNSVEFIIKSMNYEFCITCSCHNFELITNQAFSSEFLFTGNAEDRGINPTVSLGISQIQNMTQFKK